MSSTHQINTSQGSSTTVSLFPQINKVGLQSIQLIQEHLKSPIECVDRLLFYGELIISSTRNDFDDYLKNLIQFTEKVFLQASPSRTRYNAARQIEQFLQPSIEILSQGASPTQLLKYKEFVKNIESQYVTHFTEQFQRIQEGGFTGNAKENFDNLLNLMNDLANFINTRAFADQGHSTSLLELNTKVKDMLEECIAIQRATEAATSSSFKLKSQLLTALDTDDPKALQKLIPQVEIGLRTKLYHEINTLCSISGKPGLSRVATGVINRGLVAITLCGRQDIKVECRKAIETVFPKEAPQEKIAETMEQALMSLNSPDVHPFESSKPTEVDSSVFN